MPVSQNPQTPLLTTRKLTFPIIEICGSLDQGKGLIAESVASKLIGTAYKFPCFDLHSPSGMSLMALLGTNARVLESHPEWWMHTFITNLWEFQDQIKSSLEKGPVIIVNWTGAANIYLNSLFDKVHVTEWTRGLISPNITYSLFGEPWEAPGNFTVKFSRAFRTKVRQNAEVIQFRKITTDFSRPGAEMNRISDIIVDGVLKRYPVPTRKTRIIQKLYDEL